MNATKIQIQEVEAVGGQVSDLTVPDALIYEMVNGKPIYYAGWRDVIIGKKQIEQVMASCLIQSYLVGETFAAAHRQLRKKYILGTNEAGLKFQKGDWRAADIAIWTKESLKNTPLHAHYSEIIPEIVIEVDTKADLSDLPNYYFDKTKQLHERGVRRVIWILTSSEKVMVAERGQAWTVDDWSKTVEIVDGSTVNVGELIADYDNSEI